MVQGACLCGALRYEAEGPFRDLIHCHCSMCRKHHGTAFASFVGVAAERFRWIAGEDQVVEYASSPGSVRRFCGTCGAAAPVPFGDRVFLTPGNLDGDLGDLGGIHVFVGSKAPWHTIANDLPQFDTVPPGLPLPEVERPTPPTLEGATHGSCLCGDVTFRVEGAPDRMYYCHCSRCRRARSAAHAANAFYPLARFAWLSGEDRLRRYKVPEAQRFAVVFCARCGSGAPVLRDGVPFAQIPSGALDGDTGGRPMAHIHVASKSTWYTIADTIPQFTELPPP